MTTPNDTTTNTPETATEPRTVTFKAKIRKNPNDAKYPGRECSEVTEVIYSLLEDMDTKEDISALLEGRAIIDMEATATYFDSLQVGDVFGCAVFMAATVDKPLTQWVLSRYKIDSIGDDILHCTDVSDFNLKGNKVNVCFEDVSFSLAGKLTEILYRDNMVYGMNTEVDVRINLPAK